MGLRVDVVSSTELHRKVLLVRATREGNSAKAHLPRVLLELVVSIFHSECCIVSTYNCKMSKGTQTLHCHDLASENAHSAHAIEDSDTAAEKRCNSNRICILRDAHHSFGPQRGILAIPAVAHDTVDALVDAHLKLTAATRTAGVAVSAMPGSADTVTNLPFLLRGRDCGHCADELVTKTLDARRAHGARRDIVVAVADAAGVDFDQNLSLLDFEHRHILDLERLVRPREHRGPESLRKDRGHGG